jgi:hypothetical protein
MELTANSETAAFDAVSHSHGAGHFLLLSRPFIYLQSIINFFVHSLTFAAAILPPLLMFADVCRPSVDYCGQLVNVQLFRNYCAMCVLHQPQRRPNHIVRYVPSKDKYTLAVEES